MLLELSLEKSVGTAFLNMRNESFDERDDV